MDGHPIMALNPLRFVSIEHERQRLLAEGMPEAEVDSYCKDLALRKARTPKAKTRSSKGGCKSCQLITHPEELK